MRSIDTLVVGGGLAGLINAHQLADFGLNVVLVEKKKYPFHRVCGEYISNEVIPFLEEIDLFPSLFFPAKIEKFRLTAINGWSLNMPLDLGGFGVSRYLLDQWLAEKLKSKGVEVLDGTTVNEISNQDNNFLAKLSNQESIEAKIVIGSFGKRSTLDKTLNRKFIEKRSPYIGVKYHIEMEYDEDVVALHNFPGGYCGINKIEGNRFNLCYLSSRENLKKHKDVSEMERKVLCKNPHLKKIFNDAQFLFDKPEVINEISFEPKEVVKNGILMSGDSAGMITPLCGNGMAMAIHSAKMLSEIIIRHWNDGNPLRNKISENYQKDWRKQFATRHWTGRKIQNLFGGGHSSSFAVGLGKITPPIARFLMSKTHGAPF